MQHVYYIDACILVSLFDKRDQAHRFYRTMFIQHSSHCRFRISHLAFGEAIHSLMEKDVDLDLDEIRSKLNSFNIEIKKMPPMDFLLPIINLIRENDNRLNYNDILIVASAIADDDSKGLITMDSDMIGNFAINYAASEMGKKGFIVSDNPFTKRRKRR